MADDDQKQGSTSQERIAPSPKVTDQEATEEVEKTKKVRKIWKRVRKSPTFYGSVLYGWACLIGMLHARSYYQPFGIDIFDFAEPFDFLLIAISKASIVLDIWFSTAVLGIGPAFVVAIIILILWWILRLIICIYDVKNRIVCVFKSINNYIHFVVRIFISLLHSAWAAYIASVRAAWKTYATLRQAVWMTYIASARNAWKTYTTSFRAAWKTYTTSFRAARKDLKESRQTISTKFEELYSENEKWRQETRKNSVASLRRSVYISIAAAFIFATFFMPSYRGEQDARTLVSDLKSKQVGPIPMLSWIYDKTSYIYFTSLCYIHSTYIDPFPLMVIVFGQRGNQQEAPHVRVALRQDSVQPGTRLPKPDRTLILGTTSSFHFFYECGESLNAGTDSKCEKGRPFIVPTANIASLEFNPKKSEVEPRCASGWKKVATIGTFQTGEHKLLERTEKEEGAKQYLSKRIDRNLFLSKANVFQQLMLVGRVDITPLNEKTRRRYGSNNGLAQARAKWVLDELVEKWELNNTEKAAALRERTILLSAGPLHVGGKDSEKEQEVSEKDRAKDRSVEVWACGGPKPE